MPAWLISPESRYTAWNSMHICISHVSNELRNWVLTYEVSLYGHAWKCWVLLMISCEYSWITYWIGWLVSRHVLIWHTELVGYWIGVVQWVIGWSFYLVVCRQYNSHMNIYSCILTNFLSVCTAACLVSTPGWSSGFFNLHSYFPNMKSVSLFY
jgi:hypothetical protein